MKPFELAAVAGITRGRIDSVDYVDALPGLLEHTHPTDVPQGAPVIVWGWTVDPTTNRSSDAVCVLLSGSRPHAAQVGIARGEIMLTEGTDEFVGYHVVIPTDTIPPGSHELRTFALGGDGFWYESAVATFRVYKSAIPGGGRLARPLRIQLDTPVDATDGTRLCEGVPINANRNAVFMGWAIDYSNLHGAAGIAAFAEDGRMWSGPSNIERTDVSGLYGAVDVRLGFQVVVPAGVLGRGRHRITIAGFDQNGNRYANTIEHMLDVIGPTRPFPLTARFTPSTPRFVATLMEVAKLPQVIAPGGESITLHYFRDSEPIAIPQGTSLALEGWALEENGTLSDDVFIEISPANFNVPPRRYRSSSVRARSDFISNVKASPTHNAWFTCPIETQELERLEYTVSLVLVHCERRSYSRSTLGKIRIY